MKRVFVGLSGGVDSSVAAARLIRDGYEVVGVFIKVWHPSFLECNWETERLDAMRVAAHLKIPFLTCDAEETYKTEVGEYFVREYLAGRTPNPDVLCNKAVKFGAFLSFAREHDADFIATGHYAQRDGERLLRGADAEKDQSYFLWTLSKAQLAHTLFPVGDATKASIRKEAEQLGLPTAEKKDSQGICFLGHVDIPEFLSHFTELHEGNVLDVAGNVIGRHRGALVYTLGQRHGFTVTAVQAATMPHYVVAKDLGENTITVATEPPQVNTSDVLKLSSVNWITETPESGDALEAQFRYRQTPVPVRIEAVGEGTCTLAPLAETDRPADGQSCVLYRGDECMGGGVVS
jgi:tRNA-specific 2-thiouridylase